MSRYNNSTKAVEEKLEINRAQIENRAKWFAFIYDELKAAGVDAEPILRRAIRRCGHDVAESFLKLTDGKKDGESLYKAFYHDIGLQSFVPNCEGYSEDSFTTTMSYCALLNSWERLGYDDETIALLCDMAMEGDRGIAEKFGYELDLQSTLAQHCECCRLKFHK